MKILFQDIFFLLTGFNSAIVYVFKETAGWLILITCSLLFIDSGQFFMRVLSTKYYPLFFFIPQEPLEMSLFSKTSNSQNKTKQLKQGNDNEFFSSSFR